MSQWDQLMVFITLVEAKSFSEAGNVLGISGAAISKQITELEKKLNLTLVERSTRHLKFTEVGQIIYEKSKQLKQDFNLITEFASTLQKEPTGLLSVVTTVGVGQYMITPFLAEFLEKYPKLTINLRLRDKIYDLEKDEHFDIAYGYPHEWLESQSDSASLIHKRIFNTTRILCASPQYLQKFGEPSSYTDFKNHLYIMHSYRMKDLILEKCAQHHVPIKPILYVNNTQALLESVRNGLGIARIANFIVQEDLNSGKLQHIFAQQIEPSVPLYLFYKKTDYVPPKITHFIKFFLNKIPNGPAIHAERELLPMVARNN
jgi:DNA-binding transcriptional LysR family regulator